MSLHYLGKMNTCQVSDLQKKTNLAFIPIGPTEVHSYYLPTFTDTEMAIEVCERAARKLQEKGVEALIAPAIPYCVANSTNVFVGNTTIRPETVTALISDVCVAIGKWGFNRILVVSGHGEPANAAAIEEGVRQAMERNSNLVAKQSDWIAKAMPLAEPLMKSEHPELEIHAGEHEVGLMMLRWPDLVDREMLAKMEPNWADDSFWEKVSTPNCPYTFIDLGAPDAYFGNPRLATPETGDKVFNVVSDYVKEEALAMME